MKRKNNLFDQIISVENLTLADQLASRGKSKKKEVIEHRKDATVKIQNLHEWLKSGNYKTSPYDTFPVHDPKERLVFKLPYYPDRIVHHAIMNILKPIFVSVFTADTYSCIEGKGIHNALENEVKALQDVSGTKYCLTIDIVKFYPNVDHQILKLLLRKKIKCYRTLQLLDEIIDSAPGVPIGNYLSQYFANFYLAYFDHWIKEVLRVKYYFRYADDIRIFSRSKSELNKIIEEIRSYLWNNLRLEIKGSYQIFPVAARGVDFLGYVAFHDRVLIRKSIKQAFCRMLAKKCHPASIAAYYGWLVHCNHTNLLNKLSKQYEPLQRFRDKAYNRALRRRQNKTRKNTEQRNQSNKVQNRTVEASFGRQLSVFAD